MHNLKQPPGRPVRLKPTHVPKLASGSNPTTFIINFTFNAEALGPVVLFVKGNPLSEATLESMVWDLLEEDGNISYTTKNTLQRAVFLYTEDGEKKNKVGRIPNGYKNDLEAGTTYALIDVNDEAPITLPENPAVYNYIRDPKVPKISVVFLKNEVPILLSGIFDFGKFASTILSSKLYFGIATGGEPVKGISTINSLTFQELSPNQQSLEDGKYFAFDYANIEKGAVVNISLNHNSNGYFFQQEQG